MSERLVDGCWVISSRDQWLPGSYDTQRTARWAYRFDTATLRRLQERVNWTEQRPITRDDLAAEKSRKVAA